MRIKYLPLFWKFSIGIVLAVILFSVITLPIVWNSISSSLERELSERIRFISKSLAQKSINYILFEEIAELNSLVEETTKIDSTISYIVIQDEKNNVLAHSFEYGFPKELLSVNSLKKNKSNIVIIQSQNNKNEFTLDIAEPILEGKLGTIRVGLFESQIKLDTGFIYRSLLFIIIFFSIISLIFAFLYSYIITTPLKHISKIANEINFETIQEYINIKKQVEKSTIFKLRKLFFAKDEIDILYNQFINMIERIARTHEELEMTHKNMINSEKLASIGVISAGIAHEINNPIIGLQNCIKRVLNNPNDIQNSIKYFDLMNESIENISRVANSLLNFSRKQEFKLLRMNIKVALENSLQLASYHLERNHITINNNIPNEIPIILGSRNHIEQVLLNLIINSVDAIVEKKRDDSSFCGEIKFYCKWDKTNFYLHLKDNGIGIKKENLNSIFEPFYTTKEIGNGTGLGLSISYNIIIEHNGEIKIDSEYNVGTIITIVLPIENI